MILDLRCGASGDMLLSALLDRYSSRGDTSEVIEQICKAASVQAPTVVKTCRVDRHGARPLMVDVEWTDLYPVTIPGLRMMEYLKEGLERVDIGQKGRSLAERTLQRLLEGEMEAHMARSIDGVHLHEAGTPDTLVDIVGISLLYDRMDLDDIWITGTPISLGRGIVETDHGPMEVPVKAVRPMIRNLPTRTGPVEGELATPTGVAALVSLVRIWSDDYPSGEGLNVTGMGAGKRRYPPPFRNVLTIFEEV